VFRVRYVQKILLSHGLGEEIGEKKSNHLRVYPFGSQNAKGNKGGSPVAGNKSAKKHGFLCKVLTLGLELLLCYIIFFYLLSM